MNIQLHFNHQYLTPLQIDQSYPMPDIYKEIAVEKKAQIAGAKNWIKRAFTPITKTTYNYVLKILKTALILLGLIGIDVCLGIGVVGTIRNVVNDQSVIDSTGHIGEWAVAFLVYMVCFLKIVNKFQGDQKYHLIDQIYQQAMQDSRLNPYQLNRLDKTRKEELNRCLEECFFSKDPPPFVKREISTIPTPDTIIEISSQAQSA